jgi:hypothetical protein
MGVRLRRFGAGERDEDEPADGHHDDGERTSECAEIPGHNAILAER